MFFGFFNFPVVLRSSRSYFSECIFEWNGLNGVEWTFSSRSVFLKIFLQEFLGIDLDCDPDLLLGLQGPVHSTTQQRMDFPSLGQLWG